MNDEKYLSCLIAILLHINSSSKQPKFINGNCRIIVDWVGDGLSGIY